MDYITTVGAWMVNCMVTLWSAIGTWNFLGFAVILSLFLPRVVRLFKNLAQF